MLLIYPQNNLFCYFKKKKKILIKKLFCSKTCIQIAINESEHMQIMNLAVNEPSKNLTAEKDDFKIHFNTSKLTLFMLHNFFF